MTRPDAARRVARWALRTALAFGAADLGWSLWLHQANPLHDAFFGTCVLGVVIYIAETMWARGWDARDRASLDMDTE